MVKFFVVVFCILAIFCIYSYNTKGDIPAYSQKALQNLRTAIDKELETNDIHDYNKALILDNLCGLQNSSDICYFNAMIQMLFNNRELVYYLIRTNFASQSVSEVMQRICYRMLTSDRINLETELIIFAQNKNLKDHLKLLVGGLPDVIIGILLDYMISEEHGENKTKTYKNIITETYECKCGNKEQSSKKYVFFDVECLDDIEDQINTKVSNGHVQKCIPVGIDDDKDPVCKSCNKKQEMKVSETYNLAANLLIRANYDNMIDKCIANDYLYPIKPYINICGKQYMLCSILCISNVENIYHANTIVRKGSAWYIVNDTKIKGIDIENKQKNLYHWIFAYKQIVTKCTVTKESLEKVIQGKSVV